MLNKIVTVLISTLLMGLWLGAVQAATPVGTIVNATGIVQGGSDTTFTWKIPSASKYKVWVHVPSDGTATNALYRIYPYGNLIGNTNCSSTDKTYPCFETTVNQVLHQNGWVQLMLKDKPTTQWNFKKSGYISVNAINLSSSEMLSVAEISFEDTSLKIGQNYQGGIIFYLNSARQHGLIAAPTDQSTGIQWSNGSSISTGATAITVGTGQANTTKIVSKQGIGGYAARLCDNLVIGKYSDWYLPSKDELYLMYENIGQGAAAPLTNTGGFADDYYWSSSEYDYNFAWVQNFGSGDQSGNQSSNFKYNANTVRAVRAF